MLSSNQFIYPYISFDLYDVSMKFALPDTILCILLDLGQAKAGHWFVPCSGSIYICFLSMSHCLLFHLSVCLHFASLGLFFLVNVISLVNSLVNCECFEGHHICPQNILLFSGFQTEKFLGELQFKPAEKWKLSLLCHKQHKWLHFLHQTRWQKIKASLCWIINNGLGGILF